MDGSSSYQMMWSMTEHCQPEAVTWYLGFSLGVSQVIIGEPTWLLCSCFQTPRNGNCKGQCLHHETLIAGTVWPKDPGEQRHLYQAGHSKGLKTISQELLHNLNFPGNIQSLITPDPQSQTFNAYLQYHS